MKKMFPLISISLLVLAFSGCIFFPQDLRVFYDKGSSKSGNAPIDTNKYSYGEKVIVLGQGNLENDDYKFLGWMYEYQVFKPGDTLTHYYDQDIYFTALWDDGVGTPFEFEISGDEVTLIKYTGSNYLYIPVSIPNKYLGKPVTVIAKNAFRYAYIYEVNFPQNLRHIGPSAFAECNISSIKIPDSVETIGIGAFQDNEIYDLTFGTGLEIIPEGAFSGNELKSVTIHSNIKSIGNGAFFGNKIGQVIIGANVNIGSNTSFGTYGESFKKFYENNGKSAGEYSYTADFWVFIP